MEMSMRVSEDIDIGEDITPPLHPLSFFLHDSFLFSHCSACFSPLPNPPLLPTFPNNTLHVPPTLLYRSPRCSASDSSLHVSSAEFHLLRSLPSTRETSDLRAALRFLHSLPATCGSLPTERIAGLLTNREKLLAGTTVDEEDDPEFVVRIRDGARAIAAARKMRDCDEAREPNDFVLEEAALCLVLTNAVEVQDNSGRNLGIAVYDPSFCWINHSCSPNASYLFLLSSPPPCCAQTRLRIVPGALHVQETKTESGVCSISELSKDEAGENNGPRIVVRSIKRIKKGEEVTVAYTDLLQSKEIFAPSLNSSSLPSDDDDNAIKGLAECIDDAITEYLSSSDAESCCKKLEDILTQGVLYKQLEGRKGKTQRTFKLHPLHHLSLNAYTMLASAYKVRSSDLLALYSDTDEHLLETLDLSRISAAYSLLLAGATHHLFQSESSLITSVANFWSGAGDSLLTLARSSIWSKFVKWGMPVTYLSSLSKHICSKCSLMEEFKARAYHRKTRRADFEVISCEFLDCVTDITQKVWSFLAHGNQYLREVEDPVDFSWLGTTRYHRIRDVQPHLSSVAVDSCYRTGGSVSICEAHIFIFQLGVHCLLYGGYLANICYGQHSQLISHVQDTLDYEKRV